MTERFRANAWEKLAFWGFIILVPPIVYFSDISKTFFEPPPFEKKVPNSPQDVKFSQTADHYKIRKQRVESRGDVTHLWIETELSRRLSKKELEELAIDLKNKAGGNHFRTWIFHYLEDSIGKNPWAITHFKPELDLRIIGPSGEEARELRKHIAQARKNRKVVGQWEEDGILANITTIYTVGTQYWGEMKFHDGSRIDKPLKKSGDKYWFDDNYGNFYFLLEHDGKLGAYDQGTRKRLRLLRRIDQSK